MVGMRTAGRDGRSRSGDHDGVAQSESGPSGKRPIDPLLAELRFTKRAGRADTRVTLQAKWSFQRDTVTLQVL